MVVVAIAALSSPMMVTVFRITNTDSAGNVIQKFCTGGDETTVLAQVNNYIELIFYSAIPSILMLLCNVVMTVSLTAAAVKVRFLLDLD